MRTETETTCTMNPSNYITHTLVEFRISRHPSSKTTPNVNNQRSPKTDGRGQNRVCRYSDKAETVPSYLHRMTTRRLSQVIYIG